MHLFKLGCNIYYLLGWYLGWYLIYKDKKLMKAKVCLLLIILTSSIGSVYAQVPTGKSWAEISSDADIPLTPAADAWGSATYPYKISNAAELKKLSDAVNTNAANLGSPYLSVHTFKGFHFILTNDIDLSEYLPWRSIGRYSGSSTTLHSFGGTFDGDGFIISNLTIGEASIYEKSNYAHAGLFGLITSATIKNVGVRGVININTSIANTRVGLLVGCNEASIIENCYVEGTVNYTSNVSGQFVGLLVGYNTELNTIGGSTIKNCYAEGSITYTGSGSGNAPSVGGLVGDNRSSIIQDCYAMVNVTAPGSKVGTLLGYSRRNGSLPAPEVTGCYAGNGTNGIGSTDGNGTIITPYDINDVDNLTGSVWLTTSPPTLAIMARYYCDVAFSAGGSANFVNTIDPIATVLLKGPVPLLPTTAQRVGYIFNGWQRESNSSVLISLGDSWADAVTSPSDYDGGTLTLIADWTANTVTINFALDGGTGTISPINNVNYDSNLSASWPTNPTKDGYLFGGWKSSGGVIFNNAANIWNSITESEAADGNTVTLTAQWTANAITINFALNGGTGTADPINAAAINSHLSSVWPTDPTRKGYTFVGWKSSAGATFDDVADIWINLATLEKTNGNTVLLTAQWTINTVTINFALNGGTGTADPINNVIYDSNLSFVWPTNNPTRKGYTFVGWKSSGGVIFNNAANIWNSITESEVADGNTVLLTAQWTPYTPVNPLQQYNIRIVSTEGVFVNLATDRNHKVTRGQNFSFNATKTGDYADYKLIVYENGREIEPYTANSSTYLLENIRGNITITFALTKTPTGNETFNTAKVRTSAGKILIETQTENYIQVVSLIGNIVFNGKINNTTSVSVPAGIYVVLVDGKPTKVMVK